MPFTAAHPAIILPLTYLPARWISLTGLVAGSMVPDFEYFIRMQTKSHYSHTLEGLFWFDLPLGLLLAFIFHNVVRNSLFTNLPVFLKSRFEAFTHFDWNGHFRNNWFVVVVSILIGAASHIFWDGFTHYNGYFVAHIPALTNHLDLLVIEVPWLKVLQHTSTMAGGLVIAIAVYMMPAGSKSNAAIDWRYWAAIGAIAVAVFAVRLFIGRDINHEGNMVASSMSAGLIGLVLTSMYWSRKVLG